MLSVFTEVEIYGSVSKLTFAECIHHCDLIKLVHLHPGNLSEITMRIRGHSLPVDPLLFWDCNMESFLGVEDLSAEFINFAIEASEALAFLNVVCFDGGLTH